MLLLTGLVVDDAWKLLLLLVGDDYYCSTLVLGVGGLWKGG